LDKPLVENKFLRPLIVAKNEPAHFTNCTLTTFGIKTELLDQDKLQQVPLWIQNTTYCKEFRPLTQGLFCAGSRAVNGPCTGDLGGPLICEGDNFLNGIMLQKSFCENNISLTFMSIPYHQEFIARIIAENSSSSIVAFASLIIGTFSILNLVN
jgi:secreted trypsin-like serine protease